MLIEIKWNRDSNSHVCTTPNPDGSIMEIAHIFGWIAGGTPSIKVPYFTPIDAIKEIENVIQREGTGSKTETTTIDCGSIDEKQESVSNSD